MVIKNNCPSKEKHVQDLLKDEFIHRNRTFYGEILKLLASQKISLQPIRYRSINQSDGEKVLAEIYKFIFHETESLYQLESREKFGLIESITSEKEFEKHMKLEDISIVIRKIVSYRDIYARMHEFTHAKMYTVVDCEEEMKWNEFFPILLEFISAYYISEKYHTNDFDTVIRERLSNIASNAKRMSLYILITSFLEYDSLPDFMKMDIRDYNDYIIGFIYANSIMESYKKDKFVLYDIREVLQGKEKLDSFIDLYNLNLGDLEIIYPTYKLIGRNEK